MRRGHQHGSRRDSSTAAMISALQRRVDKRREHHLAGWARFVITIVIVILAAPEHTNSAGFAQSEEQNPADFHRAQSARCPVRAIHLPSHAPHTRISDPPVGLRHRHVQSLLAGWPLAAASGSPPRGRMLLFAASRDEIVDCGAGVRLLGHYSAAAGTESRSRDPAAWLGGQRRGELCRCPSAALLHEAGFEVFRLNFRDHGETFALNRDLFHSCRIDEVVQATRQRSCARHPADKHFPRSAIRSGGNFALRVAVRAPGGRASDLTKVVADLPRAAPAQHDARSRERLVGLSATIFFRRWRRSPAGESRVLPRALRLRRPAAVSHA